MKQLLTNIIERLSEIPVLKYIDENWGQAHTSQPNPVKYPMALIDVESVEWGNLGNHVQLGKARIVVSVSALRLSNTSKGAPKEQSDLSFDFYNLLYDIHCALHAWVPAGNAGPMTRIDTRRIRSANGIKTTELTFLTTVQEALPDKYEKIKLEMKIKTEFE